MTTKTDFNSVQIEKTMNYLIPLRSGTSLISTEEIEQLDKDWVKWRKEWVDRRKVFMKYVLFLSVDSTLTMTLASGILSATHFLHKKLPT